MERGSTHRMRVVDGLPDLLEIPLPHRLGGSIEPVGEGLYHDVPAAAAVDQNAAESRFETVQTGHRMVRIRPRRYSEKVITPAAMLPSHLNRLPLKSIPGHEVSLSIG